MIIILGTLELTTIGGVGTYALTVAEHLERLGHEVTLHTEETGEMAALAEERGLRVVTESTQLPDRCDAIYAQDAPSAYGLAQRYPGVAQAFCVHADEHDRWLVPQVPGLIGATVALHDRTARHARSLAHVPEVVRLHQPVDIRRFSPRGAISASPRRALAMGNYTTGNRLDLLREACAEAGIECVARGLLGGGVARAPEMEMNDCDIVVGKSRVIVEGMACGRAAYVYDYRGGDGWVTPERYDRLEADNFAGRADVDVVDADRLRRDLSAYRADMGPANRDLALAHHSAHAHAEALVALLRRIAPRRVTDAPLDELSRLTRMLWQSDARAMGFEQEARILRAELARRNCEQEELHRRLADATERAAATEREAAHVRSRLAQLEGEAAASEEGR